MKFDVNVAWLAPYLELVEDLVPVWQVKRVRGYRLRDSSQDATYGQCEKTISNGECVITLATHLRVGGKSKPIILSVLLQNFAHELAHVVHWEHTPHHWELELKIARRFARFALQQRIRNVAVRVDRQGGRRAA